MKGFYVAGDVAGVEEADVAIEEGRLAGIDATEKLGYIEIKESLERKKEIVKELDQLRSGPFGENRRRAKQGLVHKAKIL